MQSMQMRLHEMKTGFSAIVIIGPKDRKIIVKIVIEAEGISASNEEFNTVNNNSQFIQDNIFTPQRNFGVFFFQFLKCKRKPPKMGKVLYDFWIIIINHVHNYGRQDGVQNVDFLWTHFMAFSLSRSSHICHEGGSGLSSS